MRDHLPTGKVAGVLEEVERLKVKEPVFSSPELETLARRYAEQLSEDVTREMPTLPSETVREHEAVDDGG